ncbi:hypothetical protein K490DRAFT_58061 [Saccharata proteae CBS 121410]|uniref:Rhodopsin domain-containing protein n=1 Tax=Saccharata proteae CBS 121410 TaxID=1314787 RepID=A0A9P4LW57_9PEZI|nr:hypothetical protein K490DRAFT_58061 [Saccharata proteae CBS 121410]
MISNRAVPTLITTYVFTALACIFVALKIGVRAAIARSPGWDDALILCAFALAVPLAVEMYFQAKYGMGVHMADLDPTTLMKQEHWFWASTWTYSTCVGFSKLSVLVQYLRIFVDRRTRILVWLSIALMLGYWLEALFVGILQCYPVRYFWDRSVEGGRCTDMVAWWYALAGQNLFTDIAIIAVPIPALRHLQMPRRQRIGLTFAFAVGGFGCAITVVRLWALYQINAVPDVTYWNAAPAMWSAVEANSVAADGARE